VPSDQNDARGPKPGEGENQQFAMAMELPLIIVAAIGVAGLLGFFLDRWLHTKPIFMIALGAVGFGIGVRDVLRRLPDK
jgi:ATP synthase protein I